MNKDECLEEWYNLYNSNIKPPLGVLPIELWRLKAEDQRIIDIKEAIQRYIDASQAIPINFITEYNEIIYKRKDIVKQYEKIIRK